jgi:hypothetical protein
MLYVDSGTGEVLGETLPYEEYESGGETLRYYFDGTDLFAIVVSDANARWSCGSSKSANDVPSELLDIPAGTPRAEWRPSAEPWALPCRRRTARRSKNTRRSSGTSTRRVAQQVGGMIGSLPN